MTDWVAAVPPLGPGALEELLASGGAANMGIVYDATRLLAAWRRGEPVTRPPREYALLAVVGSLVLADGSPCVSRMTTAERDAARLEWVRLWIAPFASKPAADVGRFVLARVPGAEVAVTPEAWRGRKAWYSTRGEWITVPWATLAREWGKGDDALGPARTPIGERVLLKGGRAWFRDDETARRCAAMALTRTLCGMMTPHGAAVHPEYGASWGELQARLRTEARGAACDPDGALARFAVFVYHHAPGAIAALLSGAITAAAAAVHRRESARCAFTAALPDIEDLGGDGGPQWLPACARTLYTRARTTHLKHDGRMRWTRLLHGLGYSAAAIEAHLLAQPTLDATKAHEIRTLVAAWFATPRSPTGCAKLIRDGHCPHAAAFAAAARGRAYAPEVVAQTVGATCGAAFRTVIHHPLRYVQCAVEAGVPGATAPLAVAAVAAAGGAAPPPPPPVKRARVERRVSEVEFTGCDAQGRPIPVIVVATEPPRGVWTDVWRRTPSPVAASAAAAVAAPSPMAVDAAPRPVGWGRARGRGAGGWSEGRGWRKKQDVGVMLGQFRSAARAGRKRRGGPVSAHL